MARGVLPERVVIKIGASALLSGGRPDPVKLAAVADAVVRLRADGIQTVVVGSGAAAVGRTRLAEAGIPVDPTARQPAAAVGQGPLFEAFRDAFEARGLIAAQFPLTPLDLTGPEHGEGVRAALEEALDGGLVPVVNENDAVTGRGGDVLAALVAGSLRAARLLLLTDVPGLSEAGPRQDAVRRVPEIAVMTPEVRRLGEARPAGLARVAWPAPCAPPGRPPSRGCPWSSRTPAPRTPSCAPYGARTSAYWCTRARPARRTTTRTTTPGGSSCAAAGPASRA